jgi:hypothetical protein
VKADDASTWAKRSGSMVSHDQRNRAALYRFTGASRQLPHGNRAARLRKSHSGTLARRHDGLHPPTRARFPTDQHPSALVSERTLSFIPLASSQIGAYRKWLYLEVKLETEVRLSMMAPPLVTSCRELSLPLLQNLSDIFFTDSRPVLPL